MSGDLKNRHAKGSKGEEIAVAYLREKDFKILDRNWRIAEGELDIVASIGNTIAFVEVKTAYSDKFGRPEEWVNPAKCRQIGKIADAWIEAHNPADCVFRFDVIALQKTPGGFKILHIPDAFIL